MNRNLARDRAKAVLGRATFESWLERQLLAQAADLRPEWSLTALAYGWDVGSLAVCESNGERLTLEGVTAVAKEHETVCLRRLALYRRDSNGTAFNPTLSTGCMKRSLSFWSTR